MAGELKTYVPKCYARSRKTPFGDVLTIDFNVEALTAFIAANKNERGFIKFDVFPKKNPDEKSSHSVSLNNWNPDPNRPRQPQTRQASHYEDSDGDDWANKKPPF